MNVHSDCCMRMIIFIIHEVFRRKKRGENQPGEKNRLAEVLKIFYIEAQKEDGSAHSKSSLNSILLV